MHAMMVPVRQFNMKSGLFSPQMPRCHMRHQTRFDWNFAFDHGVQRSVPPSLVFLSINEPESENDVRCQAGERFTFFLGGGEENSHKSE